MGLYSSKLRHYFAIAMAILEVKYFHKTRKSCLAPSYLNLNLMKRGVSTLFLASLQFGQNHLNSPIVAIYTSAVRKSEFLLLWKRVSTENKREGCIWSKVDSYKIPCDRVQVCYLIERPFWSSNFPLKAFYTHGCRQIWPPSLPALFHNKFLC